MPKIWIGITISIQILGMTHPREVEGIYTYRVPSCRVRADYQWVRARRRFEIYTGGRKQLARSAWALLLYLENR